MLEAIDRAGYQVGEDVVLTLDAAASEFFEDGQYLFRWSSGECRDTASMVDFWAEWVENYPISSLEDPLDENDWDGWKALTEAVGDRVQLVGDDLFVTSVDRLREGIRLDTANAILIKVNQIGTLTETFETMRVAREAGYRSIVSHRSGETEDTMIADLAVALGAGQIKTGSASRTDRVSKYNQLLRIEEELGERARYPGTSIWSSISSPTQTGASRMRRLKKTILPVILLLAAYYAVFSGEYSWFALREVRTELEQVEGELTRKRQQIDSLLALSDSVESNPNMLERIARERFGMIRDGETLYRFAEPSNSVRSSMDSARSQRR